MYLFWIGISIVTLLALGFVLRPLLYKKTLSEITTENLITTPSYLTAGCLLVLLPIAALSLYFYWGSSHAVSDLKQQLAHANEVKQEIAKFGSRQEIITSLHTRLLQLPRDQHSAKGWYLLGKLYFNNKNYAEAIAAFEIAANLKPDEIEYVLQYVSANFYLNHKLNGRDKLLINKLLQLSPNNINAINLLALDAYQQKHFSEAVRYWESLLQYFPVGSDDSLALLSMIRQAQSQLPHTQFVQRQVTVSVSLSSHLKYNFQMNDTVFVYAVEVGGSNMPLAVVKMKAHGWPITVTLDDTKSMVRGKSLANVAKILIKARISRSGNALPSKGDLVGQSNIIDITTKPQKVQLEINKSI